MKKISTVMTALGMLLVFATMIIQGIAFAQVLFVLGIAIVACGILLASSNRHELIIRMMISTSFVLIMLSVFTPYSDVLRVIALLIVLVAVITGYVLRIRLKN